MTLNNLQRLICNKTQTNKHVFSRQLVGAHVFVKARGFQSALCFLLVIASAEHTDWTQTHIVDPQMHNLPKMIPEVPQMPQLGSSAISTDSGKWFSSKDSLKPRK